MFDICSGEDVVISKADNIENIVVNFLYLYGIEYLVYSYIRIE